MSEIGKMKQSKCSRKVWLPLLAIVVFLGSFIGVKYGLGAVNDPEIEVSARKDYSVFPIEIPDSVAFAGEQVPLDFFDVKESLDRELLSNTFFHSQTIRYLKLANRFFPEIEAILAEEGVPDDFKYLAVAESGLSNAVSPAGAVGFWQIRKGTAGDYGLEVNGEVDERYHLEKATRVACNYLKESYEKYGNWTMAAASYNVGRRGVDRQIERQHISEYYDLLLNEETARYLFRIISFKLIFEDPMEYGFQVSKKDLYPELPYHVVEIDGPVKDFAVFAKEHGINYKLLKYMNPWLRESYLTNSRAKKYEVRILDEGAREVGSN